MNFSPLQLELPEYPVVSVRANPGIAKDKREALLPISVKGQVLYDSQGRHFAFLHVEQGDETFPYSIELDVFAAFSMDVEGCRAAYKRAFNPEVVAVNVARILFSGAREMLTLVTSRAPHGAAKIPTLLIEPSDVEVGFEEGKLDSILIESFGLEAEKIAEAKAMAEKVFAENDGTAPGELPKLPRKKAASKKRSG